VWRAETHLRRIDEKLGTRERMQAAALAHEAGAICGHRSAHGHGAAAQLPTAAAEASHVSLEVGLSA
jgi:hypothetical protein